MLQNKGDAAPSHSRARFRRSDGAVVHYRDPRMFGLLAPGDFAALEEREPWRSLGPDAWDDALTPSLLAERLAGRRRAIKDVLLDQSVLAGLGNIQATEALFFARIHPLRRAEALSDDEHRRLADAIRRSLSRTLALTTGDEITYVEEAPDDNPFLIYGRAGEPCPECGVEIEKRTIGGRTTAFCPQCQRIPRGATARGGSTRAAKRARPPRARAPRRRR